jgi:hypothetical protein
MLVPSVTSKLDGFCRFAFYGSKCRIYTKLEMILTDNLKERNELLKKRGASISLSSCATIAFDPR